MHIFLLCGQCSNATLDPSEASGKSEERIEILFDAWQGESGQLSLPKYLQEHLVSLRTEHQSWAYEVGAHHIGWRSFAHILDPSPLSMWWCSQLYERHPKVSPALYGVYLLRCVERIMLEKQATALTSIGLPQVYNHVLEELCQSYGWQFHATQQQEEQKEASFTKRLYPHIPAPIRALLRFGHWLWTVKKYLPPCEYYVDHSKGLDPQDKDRDYTGGTIVTYFPNIDLGAAKEGIYRSRYWEALHTLLNKEALQQAEEHPTHPKNKTRWLFIRFPSPQGTLQECCAYRDAFQQKKISGRSFFYLEEFVNRADLWTACKRALRIAWQSLRYQGWFKKHCHFAASRLDLWPLLARDYKESFRGWRCLERCIQYVGLQNYVASVEKQKWYLFPMENCPWERMLTQLVHQHGETTVYGAQHSTVRPSDFRYFDDPRTWRNAATKAFQVDVLAANGQSALRQFAANSVPQDKLRLVEALRYTYLAKLAQNKEEGYDKDSLLVLTSFFQDETWQHLRLLAACIKAQVIDPKTVIIKPHPYCPVEEMLTQLLPEHADALVLIKDDLLTALQRRPVVWASNSTSAALEAVYMGLPVMVMQAFNDFDLCPLQDIPELVRTSSVQDVAQHLPTLQPLSIDENYLCLDPTLPRWQALLEGTTPSSN